MRNGSSNSAWETEVNQFKGDPAQAFWFFDLEMIEATLSDPHVHSALPF